MEGGDSSLSFGELSAPELEAADSQAEDGLSEDVLSNPSLELGGEEMLPGDALVLPCSFSLEEEEEVVDRLAFLEEGQESLLLTDSSLEFIQSQLLWLSPHSQAKPAVARNRSYPIQVMC